MSLVLFVFADARSEPIANCFVQLAVLSVSEAKRFLHSKEISRAFLIAIKLSSALANLEQSSRHLNDLTDQATNAVHQVERLLGQYSIGIPVSVPIESRSFGYLAYRKAGKEKLFRIVLEGLKDEITSWDELSRDAKIVAVTALPELIRELAEEVRSRIKYAEEALGEVSQILQTPFRGEGPCDVPRK